MKRGYTLNDIGGALSWDALGDFVERVEPGSWLSFDIDPERATWATTDTTNTILADIYDLLATVNYNLAYHSSGKKPKKPTPYTRPGKKPKEKRHVGSSPVPISEIKNVIMSKLRRKEGNG